MAEQTCRSSSSWRSWNRRAHSCHSHVCCNPPDSAPPLPHSPTMVFNESKVHKEGCRQAIQRSEGHSQQKPPTMSFCAHARSHMHDWLHASFLLRNVLWRTGDNVSTREAPRERLQLTGSGRRDIMWTLIRQCRAPPNQTDSYIMAIGNCILLAWRFVSCQCRCKSHHARVRENSLACKAWTRSLSASQ